MKLYPDRASEKIGFDALREILSGLALSDSAAAKLRHLQPYDDAETATREQARVAEMLAMVRSANPIPLTGFPDTRSVLKRVAPEGGVAAPEELHDLKRALAAAEAARLHVSRYGDEAPGLWGVARRMVDLSALHDDLVGAIGDDGQVRDDASPELSRLRRAIRQSQARLREQVARTLEHARSEGWSIDEQPTIRGGRLVVPLRVEFKRKIEGFIHDESATGQTVYVEPASAIGLSNEVRELELEAEREVRRILTVLSQIARGQIDAIRETIQALVKLDVLHAKARLAHRLDAQPVELGAGGSLVLRKARHPLLALRFADEGRRVVPLDLEMDEADRALVITGPNAGGKSVALKTVGLLSVMAACGLLLPVASESRLPFFEQVVVDMGDEQTVEEDLSTFTSHVRTLKHLLAVAGPNTLALLDEAGTGTDPAEGGALAQAVIERLVEAGARSIVTTHIGALKSFAHRAEGVVNGAMLFDNDALSPTYRLAAGVPGSSFAFEIASREGLDVGLVERARSLVGEQAASVEDLLIELAEQSRRLEGERAEVARLQREAEAERAQYADRRAKIREERENLRKQALAEADRIVKDANSAVERAIREIKEAGAEKEATRAARERLGEKGDEIARRAQKNERRRKARPKPQAEPDAGPPRDLQPGDRVKVRGGSAVADVVEVREGEAVVASGPFKLRVPLAELRRIGGKREQTVKVKSAEAGGKIGALTASTSLDLRGHRIDEAQAATFRFVDEAVVAGLNRVEVVHGKGTGALRTMVRELLARRPEVVAFDDAPPDQGGAGVTVAQLA
jgi:DNA mismatch repair protein MutS2